MAQMQIKAEEKLKYSLIENPLFGHYQTDEEKLDLESQYVTKFNEVRKLNEEKNIKFFKAIGDPFITQFEKEQIFNEREEFQEQFLDNLNDEGIHRYDLMTDYDQPKRDLVVPGYDATWDLNKNDPTKKRRQLLKKFMTAGSMIILRLRAEKALERMKTLL